MKRKGVSASLRWQVFARDGFRCRYCGVQAGEAGIVLHADHIVSVADGGPDAMDNLVTACQRCNGGKGARSLNSVPTADDTNGRAIERAASLRQQAAAMSAVMEAEREVRQEVINMICQAYNRKEFSMAEPRIRQYMTLVQRHGPEQVLDWIQQAATRGVQLGECLRYVHGIIRKIREESGDDQP